MTVHCTSLAGRPNDPTDPAQPLAFGGADAQGSHRVAGIAIEQGGRLLARVHSSAIRPPSKRKKLPSKRSTPRPVPGMPPLSLPKECPVAVVGYDRGLGNHDTRPIESASPNTTRHRSRGITQLRNGWNLARTSIMQTAFLLFVLVAAFGLLITQVVRFEIISLGLVAVLALAGILTTQEALSGFSNSATLTVAAMLVLSAGLRWAFGSPARLLFTVGMVTAVLSAFMNNTAIIALMIPVVLALSRKIDVSASKLLMPLSFFAILGGTCTLIGTSTNILVDSLYRDAGGPGFGLFEFAGIGLLYLLVGSIYLMLFWKKLPDNTVFSQILDTGSRSQFVTEITVPEDSRYIGSSLSELLARLKDVEVLELIRDEEAELGPPPETVLENGDTLLLKGSGATLNQLAEREGVGVGSAVADAERIAMSRFDLRTTEAVILPNSQLIDRRVRDAGLNRRYGVFVIAVRRLGGGHHIRNLRSLRLRVGDVLLIQGEPSTLQTLQEDAGVLLIEGIESRLTFPRKAPIAIGILVSVVALAALGIGEIVVLSLAGVAAMLLTRCMTVSQATRALDSSVLLLLAGMIPLGVAIQNSGVASVATQWLVAHLGDLGPVAIVSGFYLFTSLMTAVLSNGATAVLLTPIALELAQQTDIEPKALLVAIAFGASASFATPIGYQTNTMVMGPGGYSFGDYLRFGGPLSVIMWLAATLLLPLFWL
nr:uncharacterized transporter sll0640-like [Nerophis lumbriciformis]